MKKALMIAVTGASLAATLSLVAAGGSKRVPTVLRANAILGNVRAMGLDPINEPVRRGSYYVLHAYDPSGIEVRVVADASFGDILSIISTRALNTAHAPHYVRGPHIIQVPQAGDDNRASANERNEPAEPPAVDSDKVEEEPAPPPHRVKPKPRSAAASKPERRSDAPPPPPPGPPRTVLSAPPPPAEGPTPIHRAPRYNSNGESGDKFDTPADPAPSTPGDQ